MIELGKYNEMIVLRSTSIGLYLGDGETAEILLPNNVVPKDYEIGKPITVFLYKDSEDRVIATTKHPKLTLNQFAYLSIKDVNKAGAFADWGLEKDLMIPYQQQRLPLVKGESHVVCLYLDLLTQRLAGSTKINRFLNNDSNTLTHNEEVELLIFEKTNLVYKAIINQKYYGLLYHNEIFQPIDIGLTINGYIKKLRSDGAIDLTLNQVGLEYLESNAQLIMDYMKKNGGFIKLTDKSDANEMVALLQMSKKSFKRSLGILYKQRLVRLELDGTYLIGEGE